MQITFLSENKDKINEVKYLLLKDGIKVKAKKFQFDELASVNLEDVAIGKARQVGAIMSEPFIIDDAGIFFDAYPNFPGAFTKHVFKAVGYDGIFRLLKGKSRGAYFKCVIAYKEAKNKILTFDGACRGTISTAVEGKISHSSPFNRLFIPDGEDKTFSELDAERTIIISHRAKAVRKLVCYLNKFKK